MYRMYFDVVCLFVYACDFCRTVCVCVTCDIIYKADIGIVLELGQLVRSLSENDIYFTLLKN